MQYFVTSAPAIGFSNVWRAGRPWPKTGILVEVLQEDEDPKEQPREKDKTAPLVIGKKTWEALKGDSRIYARPAGDIEDIAHASVALADAKTRIAQLEGENADLKAKLGITGGESKPAQETQSQPADDHPKASKKK